MSAGVESQQTQVIQRSSQHVGTRIPVAIRSSLQGPRPPVASPPAASTPGSGAAGAAATGKGGVGPLLGPAASPPAASTPGPGAAGAAATGKGGVGPLLGPAASPPAASTSGPGAAARGGGEGGKGGGEAPLAIEAPPPNPYVPTPSGGRRLDTVAPPPNPHVPTPSGGRRLDTVAPPPNPHVPTPSGGRRQDTVAPPPNPHAPTPSGGRRLDTVAPPPPAVPPLLAIEAPGGPERRPRRVVRKRLLAASAPDVLPPSTRLGPPPEDRLAGANTAKSVSLATGRQAQGSPKNEVMSVAVRAGLQPRVYLEGLQYMQGRIQDVMDELAQVRCAYHQTRAVDESQFVHYLKVCDQHFLRANTHLRKRGVQLEVIDSETQLVSMLNKLREEGGEGGWGVGLGEDGLPPPPVHPVPLETVQYLTEYWDNIKTTCERLKALLDQFQSTVLQRLKKNYTSQQTPGVVGDTQLDMCSGYADDLSAHMTDMERVVSDAQILLKSFHSGIYQNLFETSSRYVDLLVVSCDLKAFPVLRLVADVALKVTRMCDIAHLWLARDQQFMQEINLFIREARHRTKKREADLQSQKEKQKKHEKGLKAANILLHNNRDKLHKIDAELQTLEAQMDDNERSKQTRRDQLTQKESIIDFLQITLSQTQRNYGLQSKRSKLSRQVKDLQGLLGTMEKELQTIQGEIQVKAEEKERLSTKVEIGEKSYEALRTDMDRFSSSLCQLESEVTDLSGQLLQLEIIQNLKTSPENVEEIYDRPSTVKLAPSLKARLKGKRKMTMK